MESTTATQPTRNRILERALELFSEQGFAGTSVGEIEAAAGLAPRRGALYKHFASKQALLDAAFAERLDAITDLEQTISSLPPADDIGAELRLIGELGLSELERERQLARIVMKDGDRFPEIAERFHEVVVERGHRLGSAWCHRRFRELGIDADPDAISQILVDSIVGYSLQGFMFATRAQAVERERMLAAWVELAETYINEKRTDTDE